MIVVDASVAVQWIANERESGSAEAVLHRDGLMAPELLLIEVANALRRKIAVGDVEVEQAQDGLVLLARTVDFKPMEPKWLRRALEISIAMSHPIYDCIYLALAEREGASLVTRDRDFITRASKLGLGHFVTTLPLDG